MGLTRSRSFDVIAKTEATLASSAFFRTSAKTNSNWSLYGTPTATSAPPSSSSSSDLHRPDSSSLLDILSFFNPTAKEASQGIRLSEVDEMEFIDEVEVVFESDTPNGTLPGETLDREELERRDSMSMYTHCFLSYSFGMVV